MCRNTLAARVDELRRDAYSIARPAHTPFNHVGDAKLPADFRNLYLLTLERECRRACRHPQAGHPRDDVEQLLADAIGKIFVVLVAAEIGKRQHANGFFICFCQRHRRRRVPQATIVYEPRARRHKRDAGTIAAASQRTRRDLPLVSVGGNVDGR